MNNYDKPYYIDYLSERIILFLNDEIRKNPSKNLLIEINSTKGISSTLLSKLDDRFMIRVVGAYDEERINRMLYQRTYYYDSVIYTKKELVNIIKAMEKIEGSIHSNWTELQKVIYIFQRLKGSIYYDPEYEKKDNKDIRTLRGLISKKTVCAGYSIIFKEMLDRQTIKCDYVEGMVPHNDGTSGCHAWNIVTVDGKHYPFDLTWDAGAYRMGNFKAKNYLGQNSEVFRKSHIPYEKEHLQDYEHTLSSIDDGIINRIIRQTSNSSEYSTTYFYGTRKDGSGYKAYQIGTNGAGLFRYYFINIDVNGREMDPVILISETNVMDLINKKEKGKKYSHSFDSAIDNLLFSYENISHSIKNGTCYIGNINKRISDISEIQKDKNISSKFKGEFKNIKRNDGTTILLQKLGVSKISDKFLFTYDCYEILDDNGKSYVQKNTIYTENDLFKFDNFLLGDSFLSRERLDNLSFSRGGYMGTYSVDRVVMPDRKMIGYFDLSKKIGESKADSFEVPSFEELKQLVHRYELDFDDNLNMFMKDLKTGQIDRDLSTYQKAIFANIWLGCAGVKWTSGEEHSGEFYAFNSEAEKMYEFMCLCFKNDIQSKGTIDTVKFFQIMRNYKYKYAPDIAINLFKNKKQTDFIDELFKKAYLPSHMNNLAEPEPLYNYSCVRDLISHDLEDKKYVVFISSGEVFVVGNDIKESDLSNLTSYMLEKGISSGMKVRTLSLTEGIYNINGVVIKMSSDGIISIYGNVEAEFHNQDELFNPNNDLNDEVLHSRTR